MGLVIGGLGTLFLWSYLGSLNNTVAVIIFFSIAFVSYLILKFAEDVFHAVGSFFAFPPVAVIIGLTSLVQGLFSIGGKTILNLF